MKNKRKAVNIILVIFLLTCFFLMIKFDVFGKIETAIKRQIELNKKTYDEKEQEKLKYETFLDESGNEIRIEMEKVIGEDEEGNKVEFWADTVEPEIIYDYMYKGTIQKIEDNKIYFLVDKESKNGSYFCEEVEDYQIIFDIDTYDLESDPNVGYSIKDFLGFNYRDFTSAHELEFLIGKYLRVQESIFIDVYTGNNLKILEFYLD